MHLTLHLTNRCNLACRYCYSRHGTDDMDLTTALRAIEHCASPSNCGLIFFGGEPLLRQNLMLEIMEWCERNHPGRFHYKVTTNGLLADSGFLNQIAGSRLRIALSHDGRREAHDAHRVHADGSGSFDQVDSALEPLLAQRPYTPIMMTVNPDTVQWFAESVQEFQQRGVKYLIASLNFAASWTDHHLHRLKKAYTTLAKWHLENYRRGRKFYFSPFDRRIATQVFHHLDNSCRLGRRQISIGPDGTFYPCVQFVGLAEFAIGSIRTGIDESRRTTLFEMNEREKPECRPCVFNRRCHNRCGCLNLQTTGDLCTLPPLLCEHERMVLPLADQLAAQLFAERNPLFIQRHYNPAFPVLSFLEDISTG